MVAKVAVAVGEFDRSGAWDDDGATSVKAWLRDEGLCGPDAHRLASIAKRLVRLPVVAQAWVAGELSNGQIRVIDAHLIDRHITLFADHEAALVPALVGLSVGETNRAMSEWRERADALDPRSRPDEPERSLFHSATLDERFVTNGAFDPLGGAIIAKALQLADTDDLDQSPAQRRADALVDVCSFFLASHDQKASSVRHRPHLNLVLDLAEFQRRGELRAELAEWGMRLDAATTSRLLCDCSFNRVVADKIAGSVSAVLDYGRTTKEVSASQWAALMVRDRTCRYPGCDRPGHWCEAHHVQWFSKGGPTRLDNLVLLCSRHHHMLHSKRGYEAKLLPDGTFEVTNNRGATTRSHPPSRNVTLRE